MSKSLRSFPEGNRVAVAQRRVAAETGGLGFLSALAFLKAKEKAAKAQAKAK